MSTTKVVPGSLIATPSPEDVAREAAARMARMIREGIKDRGGATIALSGGNSPRDAYSLLSKEDIDWTKVQVFWVDERAGSPDSDRSNYKWAKSTLLDPAKIPAGNIFPMPGDEKDLDEAARKYEKTVRDNVRLKKDNIPNLDLVVLGVGDDGHTASMFPGEDTVTITDKLVVAVHAKGTREARLTMTAPLLTHARSTIVIAVGKAKHEPLERVWKVSGDLKETPARLIREFKGGVAWIIDRAAGGM